MPGRPSEVHQFLAALAPGDAISNQALAIQGALRAQGYRSEIFAEKLHPKIASRGVPLWKYARSAESASLLHFAIGSAASRLYATLPGRRALVYHNVTPPEWFLGYSRELVALCHEGRRELRALAERSDLALGVSEFNRKDLLAAGYATTGVLPILPDLDAPRRERSRVFETLFDDGRDNLLFVGRLTPNKKIEDLIRVFAAYQRFVRPASRLILAGDHRGQERYFGALLRMVDEMRLDEVVFTGHLEDDDLRACYAAADAFLCLSEHEGFGVPLLEAMAFGLPVIAYDAAAIRETLRGAGVLLVEKRPEVVAELIDLVLRDAALHAAVLETQARALSELRAVDYAALLLDRLRPILGNA